MNTIYQELLVNQALIRENINGACMVLFAVLSLMIFVFMINSWLETIRKAHASFGDWSHMPGVPMACAMLWVFMAETYRTYAIWSIYRFSPSHTTAAIGTFADVRFGPTLGYLIAGIILVSAALRCTYLFAPPLIRRWVWNAAWGFAFFFLTISHALELKGY